MSGNEEELERLSDLIAGHATWDQDETPAEIAEAVIAAGFRRPVPITDAMVDAAQIGYYVSIGGPDDPAVATARKTARHWRHHWRAALEAAREVS